VSDAAPDFMAALGALAAHETLPDPAADHAAIRPLLDAVSKLPPSANAEQLAAMSAAVGPYLTYQGPGPLELAPGHSARHDIQNYANDCLQLPLVSFPPDLVYSLPQADYDRLIAPYLAWLETAADELTIDQALYVGMLRKPPIRQAFVDFAKRLEIAGRRSRAWINGVDEAIRLAVRAAERGFSDWVQAKSVLIDLLKHPHEMVRAGAARAFGVELFRALRTLEARGRGGAPSLAKALRLIARREADGGNVAAGFINGFGHRAGLRVLTEPSIADLVVAEGIDVRAWVLEICKAGLGERRIAANVEPWSSFVSDFFWADPDAVGKLVAMGQHRMAFLTASARPSEAMMPIIVRLAIGDDPEVARDARNFLRRLQMS